MSYTYFQTNKLLAYLIYRLPFHAKHYPNEIHQIPDYAKNLCVLVDHCGRVIRFWVHPTIGVFVRKLFRFRWWHNISWHSPHRTRLQSHSKCQSIALPLSVDCCAICFRLWWTIFWLWLNHTIWFKYALLFYTLPPSSRSFHRIGTVVYIHFVLWSNLFLIIDIFHRTPCQKVKSATVISEFKVNKKKRVNVRSA